MLLRGSGRVSQSFLVVIMSCIKTREDGQQPTGPMDTFLGEGKRRDQCCDGKSLQGAFTRYVRELRCRDQPPPQAFDEMWEALRATVIHELRRCSLWTSPPSYLGIYGWRSWQEKDFGAGGRAGALEELMADCYSDVFLKRLKRLEAQLTVKPEIDGLVFLYVRNYLHDRRKAHVPMGFRVFQNLRSAVRQALEDAQIYVIAGDPKVTSSTVLSFSPDGHVGEAVDATVLRSIVEGWNSDVIPDIMTAVGPERQKLIVRLRGHLLGMRSRGVGVLRFRDLIGPLKRDVRSRWAAIFEQEGGDSIRVDSGDGLTRVVRLTYPDERTEHDDNFIKLSGLIAAHLERLDVPVKTRRYLTTLWRFLGTYACDERMDFMPSNRKLSSLLEIPRERLPGLYDTLREVVNEYRPSLAL